MWPGGIAGDAVVELAPLEVEAWHFDHAGIQVAAEVVRLEAREIEVSGAGSVPELLSQMAGVRFRGYRGDWSEGQLALRGFGDNSGLRVLVLVDGQVMNPPDMGGINWLGLEMGELEMVEVVRGGQTVLYGNHAVAGVVKVRTRDPGEALAGRVSAEWGSDGFRRAGLTMGQRVGGAGIRLGAHALASDGYRENGASESWAGHLAVKGLGTAAAGWSGRLSLEATEMDFPGPLTYEQMRADPRQSVNGGGERARGDAVLGTLRGEGEAAWGQWQLQAGVLERGRDWDLSGTHAGSQQRRATVSPRVRLGADAGFVMAGTDVAWDRIHYTDYLDAGRAVIGGWSEIERLTLGAYLFGSRDIGPRITLSGGLRLEQAGTDNVHVRYKSSQLLPVLETNRGPVPNPEYRDPPEPDPALSFAGPLDRTGWAGELSLVAKVAPGLHLWGGWDRVFRYPAFDEAAAYQGYPLSNPLNSGLEPETGHNLELGAKAFGANWSAVATAFLLRLDDEIAYDEAARLNVNIGDTGRRGLEVAVSYQRARYGFSARGSWTRAALRAGSPGGRGGRLPLVPEFEAGATAWISPAATLRLQAHVQAQSAQFQGNDYGNVLRRVPGYGLAGLSVLWEPAGWATLSLSVSNLFDRVHAATAYGGGFYPGPGRQFTLRARCSF